MGAPLDIVTDVRVQELSGLHVHGEEKGRKRKWYYYVWDTLDKPKEERWFMFKLDAALLTFASLGMLPCGRRES